MTGEYDKAEFEQHEDNIQKKFDDMKFLCSTFNIMDNVKLPPCVIYKQAIGSLTPKLNGLFVVAWPEKLGRYNCRTHVIVTCPKVTEEHLREFQTHELEKSTVAHGLSYMVTDKVLLNQTFQFVVPKDMDPKEKFPVTFQIAEKGYFLNNVTGRKTIDTSTLPADGSSVNQTLRFDKNRWELDISITKTLKTSPEFRLSLGLSDGEKSFRKKRLPHVCKAMREMFGEEVGPSSPIETPVVSVVGSGGGYRAIVGMCGVMEALKDAGMMDMLTYVTGVSGSSWYLTSSYAFQTTSESMINFHSDLREKLQTDAKKVALRFQNYQLYEKRFANKLCIKHGQAHNFCNYFPGFVVGRQLLGKKMFSKLSDIVPFIEEGKVPYPIMVALHVKNRFQSSDFHAYVERTPYEISYPSYGINLKTADETARWHCGFRVRQCPEFPLHYTIAMVGCFFSILLVTYFKKGGEINKKYENCIEEHRQSSKKLVKPPRNHKHERLETLLEEEENPKPTIEEIAFNKNNNKQKEAKKQTELGHLESINYIEDENLSFWDQMEFALEDMDDRFWKKEVKRLSISVSDAESGSLIQKGIKGLKKKIFRNHINLISRNFLLGRTIQVNNFALGLENPKRFALNPNYKSLHNGRRFSEPATAFNVDRPKYHLSTTKSTLGIADAGILTNVATEVVLRPQRTPDLLLVMDFNAYESDDHYDYNPLVCAATQAWLSGLEFPHVDFEEIQNTPPKEFLIFPSTGPLCPTVLWFTPCNKKFRKIRDYVPRSTAKPPVNDSRPFNEFEMYDEGTNFGTFHLEYHKYNFDQLKELMYFNVTSHIEDIKSAMMEAVIRKRNRLKPLSYKTLQR